MHYGDLANAAHLNRLINQIQPDEVYNLGAQSHVRVSFDQAEYTADVVVTGTLRLLEAFRDYAREAGRETRFYQAGSSEMFGASPPCLDKNMPARSGRRPSPKSLLSIRTPVHPNPLLKMSFPSTPL